MTSRALINIGELITNNPSETGVGDVGRVNNAAMVFDNGVVMWIGSTNDVPATDEIDDCAGRAVLPGFVDSHTHLVFAGERGDEFEMRMAHKPVSTGGILDTVTATRDATRQHLARSSRQRLGELRRGGVTTVEIKSGYDLTLDGEVRLLSIAGEITSEVTFLGAHALPDEFRRHRDDYVTLVAGEMMQACAPLARWADVFCDRGAFTVGEARYILEAAKAAGLDIRLHGNQLDDSGGVELAVELDAASVDHCSHVNSADLDLLAHSSTVATLLPGAEFSTHGQYPSGRRFIDAGVTVALATDCNPGTSYITSMPLVIALAVREMGLTPDEAIWSATRGGALALRRPELGHLALGAPADVVVLDHPRVRDLAYRPGSAAIRQVFMAGDLAVTSTHR